jgi:hypothetical protein
MIVNSHLHTINKHTGERPFLRQYFLFKQALEEKYETIDEYDILVDHSNGNCYYKDNKFGVIYPKSWIDLFTNGVKSIDYFFSGYVNPNSPNLRDWVLGYSNKNSVINFSNRGRTISRDLFDNDFFGIMKNSKFSLCPQGYPYKWTYRFYEAILCKSIPILTEDDIVDEYLDYKFYIHNNLFHYEYNNDIVNHNYQIALTKLFL